VGTARYPGLSAPIYAALNWSKHPEKTAVFSLFCLLFAVPAVHVFFWWLLQFQRRHLDRRGRVSLALGDTPGPRTLGLSVDAEEDGQEMTVVNDGILHPAFIHGTGDGRSL
jgi:hypothetical protein